jgi:pyruvate,water dikinase
LIYNKALIQKKDKIKQKVGIRKEEFKQYEDSVPPKFIYGLREFDDLLEYEEDNKFKGIPASQGKKTGIVRVLDTIENISSVHPDDILIVPRTDPGWTPVFSKIGYPYFEKKAFDFFKTLYSNNSELIINFCKKPIFL